MKGLWILFWAALFMESYGFRDEIKTISHGDQLSFKMPSETEKLEFLSVDDTEPYTIWSRNTRLKKGILQGSGDSRRFVIYSVTFDDQGTYTQMNFWNRKTSVLKLKVTTKVQTQDCIPGETLYISLGNLRKNEASLKFSNNYTEFWLVEQGSPANNIPDFFDRIKVTGDNIQILNVNVSDLGNYTLHDGRSRLAKIVRLNLVDHHPPNHAPFMSLLLLGLPAGICICCRRRICRPKSRASQRAIINALESVPDPCPPPSYNTPMAPVGPDQIYTPPGYPPPPPSPAYPTQPQYSGQPAMPPNMPPNPGYNPGYSPQNPVYPAVPTYPTGPCPPWSGAPPSAPYNPPAGFGPVMYNAPVGTEPGQGDIKLNEISPATPLLPPSQPEPNYTPSTQIGQPPVPYSGGDVLNSSDSTIQFNIDGGKGSGTNFL